MENNKGNLLKNFTFETTTTSVVRIGDTIQRGVATKGRKIIPLGNTHLPEKSIWETCRYRLEPA